MRPRIKSIKTNNGILPVECKTVKQLFFLEKVTVVKVTTSGTKKQIEAKLARRMIKAQLENDSHMRELEKMVQENHIKTKYFAA